MEPRLIIHGGAGRAFRDPSRKPAVRASLHRIATTVWERLLGGASACEAVQMGCVLLEDDPCFNAGTGSVLQKDGQVRMTAAVMDGARQAFSGVINVARVQNPIALAAHLQRSPDRVVSDIGATELARELGLPLYDPVVEKRLMEWIEERRQGFMTEQAGVVGGASGSEHEPGTGTIGVVARDAQGRLAAGTSTGGRGFERIGRVSDSGMPAGNFATAEAAVSCTGVGEDIIDECLAARIVVRVTDAMSLEDAVRRSIDEGVCRSRTFAAIAIDAAGSVVWGKSTEILLAAYHDGDAIRDTMDLHMEPVVVSRPQAS